MLFRLPFIALRQPEKLLTIGKMAGLGGQASCPPYCLAFSGCRVASAGRFAKREYAVDARLFYDFGEVGKVGAVGGVSQGFDEHGGVESCNHAGLLGNNEFERGVAGGCAEDVGKYQHAVWRRGVGKVGLGALDDGVVVVVGCVFRATVCVWHCTQRERIEHGRFY